MRPMRPSEYDKYYRPLPKQKNNITKAEAAKRLGISLPTLRFYYQWYNNSNYPKRGVKFPKFKKFKKGVETYISEADIPKIKVAMEKTRKTASWKRFMRDTGHIPKKKPKNRFKLHPSTERSLLLHIERRLEYEKKKKEIQQLIYQENVFIRKCLKSKQRKKYEIGGYVVSYKYIHERNQPVTIRRKRGNGSEQWQTESNDGTEN